MVTWIFFAIAILFLGIGLFFSISTYTWVSQAQTTQGEVIELVERESSRKKGGKSISYAPKVSYQLPDQEAPTIFTSSSASNPPSFEVGEIVPIVYSSKKEQESIASFGQLYGLGISLSALGLLMILLCLLFFNGQRILLWIHPHLASSLPS